MMKNQVTNLQLWPFWLTLHRAQQRLTTWLFLEVIYFVGIGLTAALGRRLGQRFLDERPTQSTWRQPEHQSDATKMY